MTSSELCILEVYKLLIVNFLSIFFTYRVHLYNFTKAPKIVRMISNVTPNAQ